MTQELPTMNLYCSPSACSLASVMAVALLAGCAGSTTNPIFNSSAEKVYIYSPEENRRGSGVPAAMVGATGEVRYCASGMATLVQSRKQQALAAVAAACGGEDKYSLTGELMTDATGSFMGVAVQCVGNAGRAIIFKCSGAKPSPTGLTK